MQTCEREDGREAKSCFSWALTEVHVATRPPGSSSPQSVAFKEPPGALGGEALVQELQRVRNSSLKSSQGEKVPPTSLNRISMLIKWLHIQPGRPAPPPPVASSWGLLSDLVAAQRGRCGGVRGGCRAGGVWRSSRGTSVNELSHTDWSSHTPTRLAETPGSPGVLHPAGHPEASGGQCCCALRGRRAPRNRSE